METSAEQHKKGKWPRFWLSFLVTLILCMLLNLVVTPWGSEYSGNPAAVAVWHLFVGAGVFAPYFLVSLVGTALIGKIGKTRWGRSWAQILTFALLPALMLNGVGTYFARYAQNRAADYEAESITSSNSPGETKDPPITAFVSSHDSGGLTENDFDQKRLQAMEKTFVDQMRQGVRNASKDAGITDSTTTNLKIDSQSVYVTVDGKKLMHFKLSVKDEMTAIYIMGLVNNELRNVSCIREGSHDIPLSSGECGKKIYEAFGVSFRPK